jgi:hypothetical protein
MNENYDFEYFVKHSKDKIDASLQALAFLRGYFSVADCRKEIISLFDGIESTLKDNIKKEG